MSPAARAAQWRPFAIAFPIAMLVGASPACTVFDGWSDLQGGNPPGGDAGKGRNDSGDPSDDGAAATDARADQSSSGGPDDVVCGAARCPKGQACCLSTGARTGQMQCTTRAACDDQSGRYLACTRASSCPPSSPVCCFSYNDGASCLAGCGPGQDQLCDLGDPTPCTTGMTCTSTVAGIGTVPACQ